MSDSKLTGALFGMGNPLLDISVNATPELFRKYGLQCPHAILAEDKHLPLFEEITKEPFTPEYVAGGSCQNSIRVAQWMLQEPGATMYFGCVGNDANAKILRECATADGVRVEYLVDETTPTGTCAVLIEAKDRSMVANLAAANKYNIEHLKKPENEALWKSAKQYFVEGYFLTVTPDSLLHVSEYAVSANKSFGISLSAPFICQFFTKPLLSVLANSDIVFGNETEAATIATTMGWEENTPATIAKAIATKIEKNFTHDRMVIITCGADDVCVAIGENIMTFKTPVMPAEEIVDTNGAGDAFAGGFLAARLKGCDVEKCVSAGNYAAQHILRTSGTKLTGKPTFTF